MADGDRHDGPAGAAQPEDADREHLRQLQRDRQRRVAKAISIIVILVLLVVFVIQNAEPTPVDFIFFTRQPLLIYVLIVTAVLGGIVGYLLGRPGKQTRLHGEKEGEES